MKINNISVVTCIVIALVFLHSLANEPEVVKNVKLSELSVKVAAGYLLTSIFLLGGLIGCLFENKKD